MKRKLVYVCSPLRGDVEKNTENAKKYCRSIVEKYEDITPIAPHLFFPGFMDDAVAEERDRAIEMGLDILEKCDELWAFGMENPSKGMRIELGFAEEHGIKIRNGFEETEGSI